MREALSFDDVLLEPRFSSIASRSEVDISVSFGNVGYLDLPVISAPMDTVTGPEMAIELYRYGALGILHRYNSIAEQVEMAVEVSNEGAIYGAAIGATGDFFERATALVRTAGAPILCVDVAHGHHANVRYALETLKNTFGDKVHIMAGNVATLKGFNDLADWGADSIRVGIGGGSICSTRIQTGHGIPTLQSVMDCAKSDRDALLIADGGLRNSGDIVKALAAGADSVMLGSVLAGTEETPGDLLQRDDGHSYKVYRGMASKEAQLDWKGSYRSFEGVSSTVDFRGPVGPILDDLGTGIRSGLSYSGATNLVELNWKARFIRQTSAGAIESSTHIRRS